MPRAMRGLSLIELMVAVVLGLLVVLAAIGIFISNRATYQTSDAIGRIQEDARTAFELMVRDLRDADGTLCRPLQSISQEAVRPSDLPWINLLTAPDWWAKWGDGLRGYSNGSLPGSVAGTDAIELHSATREDVAVVGVDWNGDGQSDLLMDMENNPTPGYQSGDPVLLCDGRQATMFIVNLLPASPKWQELAFRQIGPATAGNCGMGLGVGPICGATEYTYPADKVSPTPAKGYDVPTARMAALQAVRWYVGNNTGSGGSGHSLYRQTRTENAAIIDGVRTLQLRYLLPGQSGYLDAAAVNGRWKQVRAVRVTLELERTGADGLQRRIEHVVNLRSRTP